jgi:hypothetical protein
MNTLPCIGFEDHDERGIGPREAIPTLTAVNARANID